MSATDQPDTPPNAEAARLEDEMDAELARDRAKNSGPIRSHLNPVFQHEQRAGTAKDEGDAVELAGRVTGEMGAEADKERREIEGLVHAVEQAAPGSERANDAEAAQAQAEKDADEAIAASLDTDVAAEDAVRSEGSRHLHLSADPDQTQADKVRALKDESVAGRDLSDLDALEKRVSDDLA
ncbi:MAG: hypothetical protein WB565_00470 [Acidimicrobiales bacterium]